MLELFPLRKLKNLLIVISFSIKKKSLATRLNKEELGFYLAGLLKGDGVISLSSIGKTKLTRILNPRIVFTRRSPAP